MKRVFLAALLFAGTAAAKTGSRQNCEAMKKDLAGLQADLAGTREELGRLQERLAAADRAVKRVSDTLQKYLRGEYQSALLNESFREETHERILQNLRRTTTARRNLRKAVTDMDLSNRGLKDSMDDLVRELADCGSKAAKATTGH